MRNEALPVSSLPAPFAAEHELEVPLCLAKTCFVSAEHLARWRGLPARMSELARLQPGWLDGQGSKPDETGLVWLEQALVLLQGRSAEKGPSLPCPYVYPTEAGGVLLEWDVRVAAPSSSPVGTSGAVTGALSGDLCVDISLEINLQTRRGEAVCLTDGAAIEPTLDLNLDRPAGWAWLLVKLTGAAPTRNALCLLP